MPFESPAFCPGDVLKAACCGHYARCMGHGEVWGWGQEQNSGATQWVSLPHQAPVSNPDASSFHAQAHLQGWLDPFLPAVLSSKCSSVPVEVRGPLGFGSHKGHCLAEW